MGNPILEAAYGSAFSTSKVVDTNSTAIAAARNTQADTAYDTAGLQIDLGNQDVIVQTTKLQGELATQNARLKAGAIFGADLNQVGEKISENQAIFESAYQRKMAALRDIDKRDSVSFMDNPLGFIINQFAVNDDIRNHNNALEQEQAAAQHIQDINALSNATAVNQKNFEISVTQASIDAGAKKILDTAQINANAATVAGLGYNVEALQTAINASKEQTAIKFQVLGAQNAQQSLALAMDNYALHKQEFDWKKEEKAKAQEGDDYFVDRIQAGLKVMYGDKAPDLGASPKLGRQMLMLLKSGGAAGKEATDAYMAGQSGILGGSPAQVIDLLKSGVALQFTPQQEPIKKIFDVAVQKTSEGVAAGSVTKANYQEVLNGEVKKLTDGYLRNIEPGSGNNPFNIGSVSAILTMPAVASTALAQKVLAPAINTGVKFDDPKQVYAAAIEGIGSGKVSVAEAVDGITALYQKGVDTNLASRNLAKFGIVPNENMHSYNTQVVTDPGALFGGTAIVDLTNKNAVTRSVLKTLAMSKMNALEIR